MKRDSIDTVGPVIGQQTTRYAILAVVQLATPDHILGRVSAVNSMFIGTSNQLGEFESGVTAALFGTVPAVILGGAGTVLVALLWMRLFPALRRVDTFEELAREASRRDSS